MSTPRAVFLLPLLASGVLRSCCSRELQAEHRSPSGTHVLSVVRVDCHAFDSFQTEIRLGRAAGAGEVVASVSSSPVVQVTWVGETFSSDLCAGELHTRPEEGRLTTVFTSSFASVHSAQDI